MPIPRPPGSQGAIALVLEQSGWATPASPAACVSDLQAAQLRLLLCFLQQERLTEHCAAVPEGGELFEIVAACFKVPSSTSDSGIHHTPKCGAQNCRILDELFTRIASAFNFVVRRQWRSGTRRRWPRR